MTTVDCVFLSGVAGEGRLRPSASVLGHVRMETHLRAAHSCREDQQVWTFVRRRRLFIVHL